MSDDRNPLHTLRGLQVVSLRGLYSDGVIEHGFHPANAGVIETPDGHARILGPCGDTMEVFVEVRDARLKRVRFQTTGCMTSIASGDMAAELATGCYVGEAMALSQERVLDALGGLPEESRHCALLAANTVRSAIADYRAREDASRRKGDEQR